MTADRCVQLTASAISDARFGRVWLVAPALAAALACGGGAADTGDGGDGPVADAAPPDGPPVSPLLANWCQGQPDSFSFFVTSMDALWALSESTPGDLNGGLGGNFGGLSGADEICQTIAVATGNGHKTWRAFLSVTDDGQGSPVHAIQRIGDGPWHDANGRLVATGVDGLAGNTRPDGELQSVTDLPDECGVPLSVLGDAHDVVTASNRQGMLNSPDPESTCLDWTSSSGDVGGDGSFMGGKVLCGHSFPREGGFGGGQHWLSDHPLRGCGKGASLIQNGPGEGTCIGCSGGYGAIYCFAL